MKKTSIVPSTPQNIADAYKELTASAFAAWIQLSSVEPTEFDNRTKTAILLNRSMSQSNIMLRELCFLRYVASCRTNPQTQSIGFTLLKKPVIVGPGFITTNKSTT